MQTADLDNALDDSFHGSENDSQNDLEDDYEVQQITEGLQKANLHEQGPKTMEVEDMEFEVLDDPKKAKRSWILSQRSKDFLEEWKKVTKFGKIIEGTNILPIKTPMMRRKWLENSKREDQFDLIELIRTLQANDKKVAAIIDINGSDNRYYNWEYLCKHNKELLKNVEYKKIKFRYDEVSNKTTLNKVYDVINKNQFKKDNIVIIHCTRGINRTGHAVCYFMCKRLEMKPDEAIRRFQEARGYPIQSKSVLEDIHDRFD